MLIAQQKRKENIAEYLIYMWQIEDQIRAFDFNIDTIQTNIIDKYMQPDDVKYEIREWYGNLIMLMQNEGITRSGHLQVTQNILSDLNNTHLYLLNTPQEALYQSSFFSLKTELELLIKKTLQQNAIEAAFHFLYGTLLLRLRRQELTKATADSLKRISKFIALLAKKHQGLESGKDEFIL